MKHCIYMCHK